MVVSLVRKDVDDTYVSSSKVIGRPEYERSELKGVKFENMCTRKFIANLEVATALDRKLRIEKAKGFPGSHW